MSVCVRACVHVNVGMASSLAKQLKCWIDYQNIQVKAPPKNLHWVFTYSRDGFPSSDYLLPTLLFSSYNKEHEQTQLQVKTYTLCF